jgi:uncharacterized protein DUF3606
VSDNVFEPRSRQELVRVNIGDPYEVRRWCQRFVCTAATLRHAVDKAGDDPETVRKMVSLGGERLGSLPGQRHGSR